jgi:hypothetical protein
MDNDERFLFTHDIPSFVELEFKLKLAKSTIARAVSPAVGIGPKPDAFWGRRPVFKPDTVRAWVRSRLLPAPATLVTKKETPPLARRGNRVNEHGTDIRSPDETQ